MSTLRIVERKYGKHKGWYVMHQRDVLSGPWVDYKTANETKIEWQFGTQKVLSDTEEKMNRRIAKKALEI